MKLNIYPSQIPLYFFNTQSCRNYPKRSKTPFTAAPLFLTGDSVKLGSEKKSRKPLNTEQKKKSNCCFL